MRLSYILTTGNRRQTDVQILRQLQAATPLPPDQWEARLMAGAVSSDFSNVRVIGKPADRAAATVNDALTECTGEYVIFLGGDVCPAGGKVVNILLSILDSDPSIGAVAGRLVSNEGEARPLTSSTLITLGATAFRKSAIQRAGGFPTFTGPAAEYDLTLRLNNSGFRIDRRDDIIFRGAFSPEDEGVDPMQIRHQLLVAKRHLPPTLARAYWQDWALRYQAQANHAKQGRAVHGAIVSARLRALWQVFSAPEPVSEAAIESVFGFRRASTAIGDWARRNSVWRVVLSQFSENLWAAYNACRSSGLQMRCVADSDPAYEDLAYRGLPIVPANRAFEGGGIDGVIIANTDPLQFEPAVKSLRAHFPGPILALCQPSRQATQAKATAA
jgi:hypothetical protein